MAKVWPPHLSLDLDSHLQSWSSWRPEVGHPADGEREAEGQTGREGRGGQVGVRGLVRIPKEGEREKEEEEEETVGRIVRQIYDQNEREINRESENQREDKKREEEKKTR